MLLIRFICSIQKGIVKPLYIILYFVLCSDFSWKKGVEVVVVVVVVVG